MSALDCSFFLRGCAVFFDRADAYHVFLAAGGTGWTGWPRGRFGSWNRNAQCLPDKVKVVSADVASHPAEEAYLLQAGGQDVQEKAADKVSGGKDGFFFDVACGAVALAEGDGSVFQVADAVVAYGDFVGVASEVFKNLSRSGEGFLGVDDPRRLGQPGADGGPGRIR